PGSGQRRYDVEGEGCHEGVGLRQRCAVDGGVPGAVLVQAGADRGVGQPQPGGVLAAVAEAAVAAGGEGVQDELGGGGETAGRVLDGAGTGGQRTGGTGQDRAQVEAGRYPEPGDGDRADAPQAAGALLDPCQVEGGGELVHAAQEGGQFGWRAGDRTDSGPQGLFELDPAAAVIPQMGHPRVGQGVGGVIRAEIPGQCGGVEVAVVDAGAGEQEVDEPGELFGGQ